MDGMTTTPDASAPFVLAFGDSLTAGYRLAPQQSFAARLESLLRQEAPGAVVQNAGVSGNTTADALSRLPRLLASLRRKPDLAIVEFGANDVMRGMASHRTRANLDGILDLLGQCAIPALLAEMTAPAFLGAAAIRHNELYASVAAKHGVPLTPFYPPNVLGHRELVLADGLHPNALGVDLIARAMLPAVQAALAGRLVQ